MNVAETPVVATKTKGIDLPYFVYTLLLFAFGACSVCALQIPLFAYGINARFNNPVLFFILVVTGKTDLPRWACVFNTFPAFLLLAPTKVPAKGNIANAFMFLGLTFLI